MGSLALTCGAWGTGCGGQTTPGSSNAGKEAACAELCQQTAACDDSVDAAECEQNCTEDELLSRSGQELLTECLAQDECGELDASETLACLEDGLFDLPLTEAQEDFCEVSLEHIADCNQRELSRDEVENCRGSVVALSDEFVTELSECTERPNCDRVNACVTLKALAAINEDQLEQLFGGAGEGLGSLVDLEDLFGSIAGSLGGAGPG